jgi:hypothetical protein
MSRKGLLALVAQEAEALDMNVSARASDLVRQPHQGIKENNSLDDKVGMDFD